MGEFVLKCIRGEHIEVFLHGVFQFSADSFQEAKEEIENLMRKASINV